MREQIRHRTGALPLHVYRPTTAPCHWHDEIEFIIPSTQPCQCLIDSIPVTIEVGQALLIQPRQLHAITCTQHFYAVVFHPVGICGNEMLSFFPPDRHFRALYTSEDGTLMQLLHKLCATPEVYGRELLLKGYAVQIMGLLLSTQNFASMPPTPSPFSSVLSFVEEHALERLTLDDVAATTHFSVSYISHAFRRFTGQTFNEFLHACRITKAADLLTTTDDSILNVALSCGYDNVSYFIKRFKAQLGTTPHQYRTAKK